MGRAVRDNNFTLILRRSSEFTNPSVVTIRRILSVENDPHGWRNNERVPGVYNRSCVYIRVRARAHVCLFVSVRSVRCVD